MPQKPKKTQSKAAPKLEIKLLDEAMKKKVIECIEKRGKITITLKETGRLPDDGGFRQLID